MTNVCSYCGDIHPDGGYCWMSPDGEHDIYDDPDEADPYNCCDNCGIEMPSYEAAGYVEHICNPEDIERYKAWKNSKDARYGWDWKIGEPFLLEDEESDG